MQVSNGITRETLQVSQRAWIGIKSYGVDPMYTKQHLTSRVVIHNYGLSPGRRVEIDTATDLVWSDTLAEAIQAVIKHIDSHQWNPEIVSVLPQSQDSTNINVEHLMEVNEIADISSGKAFLIVAGQIKYRDIFDQDRLTTFCGYFNREKPIALESCGTHEDMR